MTARFNGIRELGYAALVFSLVVSNSNSSLHAQAFGSDEVRLSSRPYFPLQSVLRVRTNEVQVSVVVHESNGKLVPGLQAHDFEIYDDGRKQQIAGFDVLRAEHASASDGRTRIGNSPITNSASASPDATARYVAIFFDDTNTQQADLARVLAAARDVVNEQLVSRDQIGIFTSSGTESVSFTHQRRPLLDALSRIRLHPRYSFRGELPCKLIKIYEAYLIAEANDLGEIRRAASCYSGDSTMEIAAPGSNSSPFTDSSVVAARVQANQVWYLARAAFLDTLAGFESVVRNLATKPGNRILLVASDGFITNSMIREKDRIINEALRAGVVINALDAKALYSESPGSAIDDPSASDGSAGQLIHQVETLGPKIELENAVMAELSDATGGRFIHNSNDLTGGLRNLTRIPEISYVLSFVPSDPLSDGKYHKLRIRLVFPLDYVTQARPGYFASNKEDAARPTQEDKLDREVSAANSLAELPASVSSSSRKSPVGDSELSVTVHVDLRPLEFQKQKDREVQQLNFVIALFDATGNFVVGKRGEIDLALKPDSFARLEATGINGSLDLRVPAGAYRLRTVTQESVTGKLAASSQDVILH